MAILCNALGLSGCRLYDVTRFPSPGFFQCCAVAQAKQIAEKATDLLVVTAGLPFKVSCCGSRSLYIIGYAGPEMAAKSSQDVIQIETLQAESLSRLQAR